MVKLARGRRLVAGRLTSFTATFVKSPKTAGLDVSSTSTIGNRNPATWGEPGSFVKFRLNATADCRRKIATRLKLAGCPVEDTGQDWLHAGDFAGLAALRRSL